MGPLQLLLLVLASGATGSLATQLILARGSPNDTQAREVRAGDGTSVQCSFADAVARAAPSVVSVYTDLRPPLDSTEQQAPGADEARGGRHLILGRGVGSGVVFDPDGLIVTNRHVIEGAGRISVTLSDGRRAAARLLGTDSETDLALISVDEHGLPAAPLGRTSDVRPGDLTFAIGSPFGLGQTTTMGIVSAKGRRGLGITPIEDFIQTDAAINPGSSGGALINAKGEVIGINTAIYSESGASQGVGFAVPIDLAESVARRIARDGSIVRGWLGISGDSVTAGVAESYGLRVDRGVLVSSTAPKGPAELAGVRAGDVITRVNEREISSALELSGVIAEAGPSARLELELWRGSRRFSAFTTTTTRPAKSD